MMKLLLSGLEKWQLLSPPQDKQETVVNLPLTIKVALLFSKRQKASPISL